MRVLFITDRFPGALPQGDAQRALALIRELAPRHAITLLSFAAQVTPDALAQLQTCCERVVLAPRPRLRQWLRVVAALPGDRPLQVALHDGVPAGAGLDALLRDGGFDLVHLQLARLGGLLPQLQPLPCVLDFVDALSLNMARRAQWDRSPWRFAAAMEARRLAHYERELCARVAAATVCAAADRAAIGDFPNLHLVRNGVDLERFRFVAAPRAEPLIVFTGNLGYFPNIDAALWFAEQVLPQVVAALPQVRLRLVGARPAAALRKLARRQPQVELIGPVDDMPAQLAAAAVAVVPLRAGSGQQFKLIEAMAAGTPVVATRLAAAGIGAIAGRHLLIGDNAADMAAAVLRLLREPALGLRLAQQARCHVEQHHAWSVAAAELESVWQTVHRAALEVGAADAPDLVR